MSAKCEMALLFRSDCVVVGSDEAKWLTLKGLFLSEMGSGTKGVFVLLCVPIQEPVYSSFHLAPFLLCICLPD